MDAMRGKMWHRGVVAAAIALAACAPERPSDVARRRGESQAASSQESKVVAVVAGEELTSMDYERRLSALAPYARAQYTQPERRVELLESMVDLELLADEAERRGLGEDPAVRQAMKETMARLVVADEIRATVSFDAITREDVEAYVAEHPDRYARPEKREALVVAAPDRASAAAWAAELRALPDVSARLGAASAMAAERSVHPPTRESAGAFGWVEPPTRTTRRPEVARAVFALGAPGDVSEPIKGPGAIWWVVVYRDRRPSELPAIDAIEADVRERIYAERRLGARDALVAKLKSEVEIERFPDALDAVKTPRGVNRPLDSAAFTPPTRSLNLGSEEREDP
jgi:peptidyl-prolyl cis-trans isomerase C